MLLYNPPNLFDVATHYFRDAVAARVVPEPEWMRLGSRTFLSWAQRQPQRWRERSREPDLLSTLENPATLRVRFSTLGPFTHPSEEAPFAPWIVEVGRIDVPWGQVGIVEAWEQYLADSKDIYSATNHWGNPFAGGLPIRWLWRLSEFRGPIAPFINALMPVALPGRPFTDWPEDTDLWHKADTHKTPLRLIVPGGSSLRLFFFQNEACQTRISVASRLRAYVQSAYSDQSQINQRVI